MGGRTIGRMIANDEELVNGLKALEKEKPGGRDVRFTDIDFNKQSFENQIRTDLGTDILVPISDSSGLIFVTRLVHMVLV